MMLLVVDTFGYFFRNFYALPRLKSKDGRPTGVLLGFANLINQLFNDECDYLIFALEGGGESVRKQISNDYKANRRETDPELISQIQTAIEWIAKMRLSSISISGFEADDVIASLSRLAQKEGIKTKIISFDKDLYQLIDNDIFIYDPIKKKDIHEEECFEKFGVYPKQFVDYQSLVGDSSDNISGIKGIGAKSVQKLLSNFDSLDGIYEHIPSLKDHLTPRLVGMIIEGKDAAYKSRELVRLRDDLLPSFDLESTLKPAQNPLFLIEDELKSYDINILSKIKKATQKDKSSLHFECIKITDSKELHRIIDLIDANSIVAFDTETTSLDVKSSDIVGFSFATSLDIGYYVPLSHFYLGIEEQIPRIDAKSALAKLLKHHIVGHNLKFDMAVVKHNFDLDIDTYSDTLIFAWLKNPSSMLNLDYQAKKIFDYTTIKFEDIVNKGDTFASVPIDVATKYGVQDSIISLALYYHFIYTLDSKLINIARDVEFPFIKVLMDMEGNGIGIDLDFFDTLKIELDTKIKDISSKIYHIVGSEFNINSTKQLGDVLFNQLNLKKGRTLKSSGYSTDEKTLESLKDSHSIIPLVLEHRELNKLLNTYVIPIINFHTNGRIYTSFMQTGTSTGRLSSRNPNLQNIPVKTPIGRRIRYGFTSRDGYSLISADYSQIELRLLAHFSQDTNLLEAFKNDKDIHLEAAIKIFGEERARENRNIAKSINFGLIYGMGVKKLAQTLKISQSKSKEYIDSYFESFPTVKDYLQKEEDFILRNGYALTLLGRSRIFDFHNVAEYEKLAFLREGVNAIFQGSAADLIKLSMMKCFERFKNTDTRLLLQVHDELIFEVKDSEVSRISEEILEIMNHIYTLRVPLKCGISIGKRWSELK